MPWYAAAPKEDHLGSGRHPERHDQWPERYDSDHLIGQAASPSDEDPASTLTATVALPISPSIAKVDLVRSSLALQRDPTIVTRGRELDAMHVRL
jgi:hypothetical protein